MKPMFREEAVARNQISVESRHDLACRLKMVARAAPPFCCGFKVTQYLLVYE